MPNKLVTLEGFVISSAKYQEKDALIKLLTRDKVVSIKVRNGFDVASKNHLAILAFNKVSIDCFEMTSGYLTASGVKTLVNYTSLYEKITPNLVGQLAGEIVLKCFGEDDIVPYDFYEETLNQLMKGFDPLTLAFIFACQGIKEGITPEINECVNCGKKRNLVSFAYDEGGFLCDECATEANYPKMDNNYLKVIRYGYLVDAKQLSRAVLPKGPTLKALEDTIKALEEQLGAKIKSYSLMTEAGL